MSDSLASILKTVDNIKSAWELGNSEMVAADSFKLAAQLAAGFAVESGLRTYSALDGLGRTLSLWRLDMAIAGKSIAGHQALSGVIAGEAVGRLIDGIRGRNLGSSAYDLLHPDENPTISPTLGTTPDPLVKVIQYVDPLVLDLDGDGLEITPLSKGILFDANGDTLKTGTAWVGADDGLLVWDRNGNGSIDTGAELFGDETVLANGKKAAHGFAALSALDTGSVINGATVGAGDGMFDAKDAKYSTLRIWRDLNQDGISQANELKTLAETGLASIKLDSSTTSINYGDAVLVQNSTFTRSNGSNGQAGSFILAQNNFSREFAPIVVSDASKALAGLKGSGWVRDLQEAG